MGNRPGPSFLARAACALSALAAFVAFSPSASAREAAHCVDTSEPTEPSLKECPGSSTCGTREGAYPWLYLHTNDKGKTYPRSWKSQARCQERMEFWERFHNKSYPRFFDNPEDQHSFDGCFLRCSSPAAGAGARGSKLGASTRDVLDEWFEYVESASSILQRSKRIGRPARRYLKSLNRAVSQAQEVKSTLEAIQERGSEELERALSSTLADLHQAGEKLRESSAGMRSSLRRGLPKPPAKASYPGAARELIERAESVNQKRNGKKHGRWELRSDQSGKLLRVEHYARGRLHGEYVSWSDGIQKKAQGTYERGKKQGRWIERELGEHGPSNVILVGSYRNGKRHGTWIRWWDMKKEYGKVYKKEITYRDGRAVREGDQVEASLPAELREFAPSFAYGGR